MAAQAAIRHIGQAQSQATGDNVEIEAEAADRVIQSYRKRLEHGGADAGDAQRLRAVAAAERRFRLDGLQAQRDELYQLRRARQIDDTLHRRLVREIDLLETSLSARPLR